MDTTPRSHARRSAARWLGISIAITPIIDIVDRTGVLTATTQLDANTWLQFTGQVVAFATLGSCAAWLLDRNAPRDRTWFFLALAGVESIHAITVGLRPDVVAGLLALAVSYAHLRIAGAESASDVRPLPR